MTTDNRLAVKVKGNFYGYIENGTFVKEVYGSRHKLRKPEAWAIDADSFDKLIRPACKRILIKDKETHLQYSVSIDSFMRNKGEIDREYGRQYFLIIEHWRQFI
jgi:hypothetical protein